MLYKYGRRTRDFCGRFYCYFSSCFGGVFNNTIVPLTLAGFEMISSAFLSLIFL